MIRHCAFFRFKQKVPKATILDILNGFFHLAPKLDGLIAIQVGENVSSEGLDRGFCYGLIMDFETLEARDAYLIHPDHLRLAERVATHLLGGIEDGVIVFDISQTPLVM